MQRLVNCPALSISKVRGRAWAQGFEFALATDMIFASKEKAKFSLVKVGGGSIPGGGGVEWLSNLCGRARALEIVLNADEYGAELGERYGFVNRAVADDELDDFVDRFARHIASFPKRSLYIGKKLVNARAYAPSEATLFTSNYMLHPYFFAKSEKYFSNRSPLYTKPAEVDNPAPAPITMASAVSISFLSLSSCSTLLPLP